MGAYRASSRTAKLRRLQLDEAYGRSAALVPAWRSAVARAIARRRVAVVDQPSFRDAARDLGIARLDRGIAISRRSLDRLMDQAVSLSNARLWARKTRGWVPVRLMVDRAAFMRP